MSIGHSIDEQVENLARMKGITVADALSLLGGKGFANSAQAQLMARGGQATQLGRLAGGKVANSVLRFVPGLATATAALGAADIVAGGDSFGNKVMDLGGMGIGGVAGGMLGGPVGAAIGSSLGKTASDATQAIFGGGKSAEQRKMEEALMALRGGMI